MAESDDMIGRAEEDRKRAACGIINPWVRIKVAVERLVHQIPERIAQQGAGKERNEPEGVHGKEKKRQKKKLIDIYERCRHN